MNVTAENWHTPYAIPIHWGAVPTGFEHGFIRAFNISLKPVMVGLERVVDGKEVKITIKGNETFSMIVDSLETFTTYDITVAGITSGGEGVRSSPILAG